MKKIIAFGASNSSTSINKQLATFAGKQLQDCELNVLDLNDFEMPLFGVDKEKKIGSPEAAQYFKSLVRGCDGIIISFAEHNGSYTVAFKNVLDWASRVEKSMWQDKPMLLLATSPGGRGGQTALASAVNSFPHMGGKVLGSFALPSFGQNFDAEKGISDEGLKKQFEEQLDLFAKGI